MGHGLNGLLPNYYLCSYGSRQTTEECPLAVILMCVQSVVGVIISACQAGIIFAKLARPKARAHTIQFSKNAAISLRNGCLYMLFRYIHEQKVLQMRAMLLQPTML